jgi:hypothetical protein
MIWCFIAGLAVGLWCGIIVAFTYFLSGDLGDD